MTRKGSALSATHGPLVLGLMSGTSHDGVDASIVEFGPSGPELVYHCHIPCPAGLRKRIAEAPSANALTLSKLDYDLGAYFANAALKCLKEAGVRPARVEAIASHGQTVAHLPGGHGKMGATMQLGSPPVIARATGIRVVSDFRAADIAAGGQGAPLVPYADKVLFGHLAPCAVHNIGGISNVTVIPPGRGKIIAFDTGPGNSLMDTAMKMLLNKSYDRGGATARRGRADQAMLKELMSMAYLRKHPPKSTGWDEFGPGLLESTLRRRKKLAPEDIMATLAEFTACSIGLAYERFVMKHASVKQAIFAGGGIKNTYLMELVKRELSPIEVNISDEFGVPSSARESMSFAILARETLADRPSNVPSATGARSKAILGSITSP